eukprot:UN24783
MISFIPLDICLFGIIFENFPQFSKFSKKNLGKIRGGY